MKYITKQIFKLLILLFGKNGTAIPDNRSCNRLTRITEFVFVIVRKNEIKTFQSNKEIISITKNNIKTYTTFNNLVEAKNNDGSNNLNKATYSTELCDKLLDIYAKENNIIYDPFMGTGTTAISTLKHKCYYIGSEISDKQVKYANERIKSFFTSQI